MILGQALSYKTKRFQKNNGSLRKSTSFAEAKHVAIIFSNDNPDKAVIAEKLNAFYNHETKHVKILAYDRNVDVKHLPFESFSAHDLNFWGNYTKESINNFAQISFDFLICLDENPGRIIRNLLAKSKAKCRVGVQSNIKIDYNMFELTIHDSIGNSLVESISSYTKNIR